MPLETLDQLRAALLEMRPLAQPFDGDNFEGKLYDIETFDVDALLDKYKSPVLNHLIVNCVNWDVWERAIESLLRSEYTDVGTLAKLYWLTQPDYFVQQEIDGKSVDCQPYLLARDRLTAASSEGALFASEVDVYGETLAQDIRDKMPPLALQRIPGFLLDDYAFWCGEPDEEYLSVLDPA